jgi:hypothetical protein
VLTVYDVDLALVWNLTLKEKGKLPSGTLVDVCAFIQITFKMFFCFVVVFEERYNSNCLNTQDNRNEPTDPIRNRTQHHELFQSRVLQENDVSVVLWELTIRQWLLDWQQPRPLPLESRNNTPPPRRATGRSFKQL